jgi:hypothetical protein
VLNPGGQFQYESRVLYGYNMQEPPPIQYIPIVARTGTWDVAIWDSSVWAGDASPERSIGGAQGLGSELAVAFRFLAVSKIALVGWHLFYTLGGRI